VKEVLSWNSILHPSLLGSLLVQKARTVVPRNFAADMVNLQSCNPAHANWPQMPCIVILVDFELFGTLAGPLKCNNIFNMHQT
jgi:hypothetical protein